MVDVGLVDVGDNTDGALIPGMMLGIDDTGLVDDTDDADLVDDTDDAGDNTDGTLIPGMILDVDDADDADDADIEPYALRSIVILAANADTPILPDTELPACFDVILLVVLLPIAPDSA